MAGGVVGAAVSAFQAASSALDSMSSGPSSQKFHVNKDTVLKAGKIIQDQADRLRPEVVAAKRTLKVHVDGEAAGKVSADIAGLWNKRLTTDADSYLERIVQYVDNLDKLAEQLQQSAKQYGLTEEEITAVFGKTT
ncbi:hypothetical protein ACFWN2_40500 [Lentzea sp. NPDC058436]|uniref:hypothetical protein n=1 Tax=Lentzea sp. NPDC058436 TaxID=3346499 RepID=UPI00365B9C22